MSTRLYWIIIGFLAIALFVVAITGGVYLARKYDSNAHNILTRRVVKVQLRGDVAEISSPVDFQLKLEDHKFFFVRITDPDGNVKDHDALEIDPDDFHLTYKYDHLYQLELSFPAGDYRLEHFKGDETYLRTKPSGDSKIRVRYETGQTRKSIIISQCFLFILWCILIFIVWCLLYLLLAHLEEENKQFELTRLIRWIKNQLKKLNHRKRKRDEL